MNDKVSNFAERLSILLSICSITLISVNVILLSVNVKLPVRHQQAFLVDISHTIGRVKNTIDGRDIIAGGENWR